MNLLFNEAGISMVAIDGQPVKPYQPDSGRILRAPGTPSAIDVIIGECAYEIASFVYRQARAVAGCANRLAG